MPRTVFYSGAMDNASFYEIKKSSVWLWSGLALSILAHLSFLLLPAAAPRVLPQQGDSSIQLQLQPKPASKSKPTPEPTPVPTPPPVMTKAPTRVVQKKDYSVPARPASEVASKQVATKEVVIDGIGDALSSNKPRELITHYADIKPKEDRQEDGANRAQQSVDTRALFAIWEPQIRRKVERIGQMNFPKDENGRSMFGTLQFRLVLNGDGNIAALTLEQTSGNPALDEAALQIVRRSATFGPVPPALLDRNNQIMLLRYYQFINERAAWGRS
ncbi:TonB family protein [Iodobacter sp. CM08]|uniref:energy transducer TonB n=1 Tax=Iodobacter sp. CM08 TaxID=3085902 RepID=UPI002980D78B|nr:TonB family protein [Iodobacter sp. CM08]MDW5419175.1 TonB family protein [Iodobacter sp. CM08]